jgi:hypothetical protein
VSGVAEQEVRPQHVVVAAGARSVAPACVLLYLAVVAGLLVAILHRTGGVFTYTLDDPYIHLALAENIAHGHYGINPGEAASPSSSIVWPFLLAPFARMAWAQYLPLALNGLFCGMTAWLIGRMVDGWDWLRRGSASATLDAGWGGWVWRFISAAALMLVANLAGLTFVGMEHGLQVLAAVACAAGLAEAFAGRRIPAWCLVAAALGTVVRYEDFALVAAVAMALLGQGRRGTALRVAGASLVGPVAFSGFLLSRGLPALPTSVLVKSQAYAIAGGGMLTSMRQMYWGDPNGTLREPAWWGQLAVAVVLLVLAAREKNRARRFVLGGALLAAMLQLAIGRVNWFHRYEVYAMALTALVASTALVENTRIWRSAVVAGLLALGIPYEQALRDTPAAASNIYQQQYQMHRFVAEFYPRPVAVNDLGWVSYRRPAGVYVLDLWGLASPEASRQRMKDAGWLEDITSAHHAGLAMIYPAWYQEGAPDEWDALATMCIAGPRISVGRRCVAFYRTEVGDKSFLEKQIAAFAKTLPAGVTMTLGRGEDE